MINTKRKLLLVIGALFIFLLLLSAPLTALIYKVGSIFTGEESLFIAGVLSASILCSLVARKWPEQSVSICFWATFLTSSLLAGAAMYLANIFESFLIPMAFYVICLVGVVAASLVKNTALSKEVLQG
ncbi:hypothetical protein [Agarilytica rhodophyticola]|uniref:hypothetical protein n=1 Tax=Agarilytica rhodophyticola TaxID=1737490 RepID=UPI000B34293F|nr:hypothetical protein [Agarilytica rhodophyticola]